jgi:hypothetical protein
VAVALGLVCDRVCPAVTKVTLDKGERIPENARLTVPSQMPSSTSIAVQDRPAARTEVIVAVSAATRASSKTLPLARADASPERTRSQIWAKKKTS